MSSFKISKGGRCLVDFNIKDKTLLIETFSAIEEIFDKVDKEGTLFGSADYHYKLITIDELSLNKMT
jgi:hypothetical protein